MGSTTSGIGVSYEFDWTKVPPGTQVVCSELFLPKKSKEKWKRRPDGLFEFAYLRMRKRTEENYTGELKVLFEPLFCEVGNKKNTFAYAFHEFAFADKPEHVAALIAFVAEEKKQEEIRKQEREEKEANEKRKREEEWKRAREQREQELRTKAASIGVSYEELVQGCKQWDELRRQTFRPDRCFVCGRVLTDPVSITTGIGPECVKKIPALLIAMKANAVDIGKLRFRSDQLIERLTRAGFERMAFINNADHTSVVPQCLDEEDEEPEFEGFEE